MPTGPTAWGGDRRATKLGVGHASYGGDRRRISARRRSSLSAVGILAIAGEGMASEDFDAEPSRPSIHWLSSPSGQEAGTCSMKCGNDEASVNWLVSPRDEDDGVDLLEDEIFVPRCSLEDAFWHLSPGLDAGLPPRRLPPIPHHGRAHLERQ